MGRPERPLDASSGPIAAFAQDLRELRRRAGNPSYRELAGRALFAPSVLSSAAGGRRLPTLAVTLAFVTACGGDPQAWECRWRELARRSGVAPVPAARDDRPAVDTAVLTPQPGRPAQLPMAPAAFVGRAAVLTDLCHLVGPSGAARAPVLVSGPIGVGKSALALRLAEATAACFPDGQLYADLADRPPDGATALAIVRDFLRALGVPAANVPDDPMQQIGLYRSLLADRRLFVLLANVRHEAQVRPLLAQSAHSQVVLTSRARLLGLDGTHRVQVGAFRRAESVALLGSLAGVDRVRAEPAAADAIAELCGDLPLALNVVGRRIAARPEWTIAHIAGQLTDRDRLLDTLEVGDVRVRERFAEAYHRLPPPARGVVRGLGSGGARWTTAIGMAAATGVPVDTADDVLESLVDAGLLHRGTVAGRYSVPTLVGVYAEEMQREAPPVPIPLIDRRARRAVIGTVRAASGRLLPEITSDIS